MFHHEVMVRLRDCDEFGHVNNAIYFTYLEEARVAYYCHLRDELGAEPSGGATSARREPGFILARAECDFLAQATRGDVLEVRLRVASIGRSSFGYEYEIRDAGDGRSIAKARSVQVAYDYATGRSVPIPTDFRAVLEREAALDPEA